MKGGDGILMSKILWFVKWGPDESHMWDAKVFNRLKDAKAFANILPPTPTGGERPIVIERAEYIESNVYGDVVRFLEVKT